MIEKEGNKITVSISFVLVALSLFLSLIGTVYAMTVQNVNQQITETNDKVTALQAKYDGIPSSLETIRINVAVLCVALKANCK